MLFGESGAVLLLITPKSARSIAKSISTSTAIKISQIFLFKLPPQIYTSSHSYNNTFFSSCKSSFIGVFTYCTNLHARHKHKINLKSRLSRGRTACLYFCLITLPSCARRSAHRHYLQTYQAFSACF